MLWVGNLIAAHQTDLAMTMGTLHRARQARNGIAHEGASIGAIWSVDRDRILQYAVELGRCTGPPCRDSSLPRLGRRQGTTSDSARSWTARGSTTTPSIPDGQRPGKPTICPVRSLSLPIARAAAQA